MDNYSTFAVELITPKVDFKQIPTLTQPVIPFRQDAIEKYYGQMKCHMYSNYGR